MAGAVSVALVGCGGTKTVTVTVTAPGSGSAPQAKPPSFYNGEPTKCEGSGTFTCHVTATIKSSKGLDAGSIHVQCPKWVAAASGSPRTVLDSPAVGVDSPYWLKIIVNPPEDNDVEKWGHLFSRLDKVIWITYSASDTGHTLPQNSDTTVNGTVTCTDDEDRAYIVASLLP